MGDINKNQIILDMCMTHRHDFGLDAKDSGFGLPSAGMTDQQRDSLRREMEQLYEHHFESVIAAQAARIAELEAACKRAEQVINRECQAAAAHHMRATALSFELEACRKDAERYRWLCEKFGITKLPCAIERILEGDAYVADGKNGIDAAIDAVMQEAPKP